MTENKNDRPVGTGPVAETNVTCDGLGHFEPFWSHVARCSACTARLSEFVRLTNTSCERAAIEGDLSHLDVCDECRGWADLCEDVEIEDTLFEWSEQDRA